MLVQASVLVNEAAKAGICVPAFNVYNLETMQAALAASRLAERDVILAFGAGYLSNASLMVIARMAEVLAQGHPHRVALHLDHCRSLELLEQAAEAGFTSLMFDGSHLPFEQNIQASCRAREIADAHGCSLEGELGGLNAEDGSGSAPDAAMYTDPRQAAEFARRTKVDFLAVSIGNVHGEYKGAPHLNMERLRQIKAAAGIPLVLHGSSGIPQQQIREAIRLAVHKINVNTELALAATQCAREMLSQTPKLRLEALMLGMRDEMVRVMHNYFV